jgi:dTMP kinase
MTDGKKKLGYWAAFEGPDGVGKTTLAKAVHETMFARGSSVTAIVQPSQGPIGQLLRTILRRDVKFERAITGEVADLPHWQTMSLLFAADRKDQYEREIVPKLETFRYVLSDRGPLSNLVYQTVKAVESIDPNNLPELTRRYHEALKWLHRVEGAVGRPDLTFLLMLPAELAAERRAARGEGKAAYDDAAMQRRITALYAQGTKLAFGMTMDTFIELDARLPVPDLVDLCIRHMDDVFET